MQDSKHGHVYCKIPKLFANLIQYANRQGTVSCEITFIINTSFKFADHMFWLVWFVFSVFAIEGGFLDTRSADDYL